MKARPGWSVRRKRRRAGLTTPVCAASVASRLFLNGAATPPVPGGEYPRLTILADPRKTSSKSKFYTLVAQRETAKTGNSYCWRPGFHRDFLFLLAVYITVAR